jgi:hypothetical protein
MTSRLLDLFEVVQIGASAPKLEGYANKEGIVVGVSHLDDGSFSYAVLVQDIGMCVFVPGEFLTATDRRVNESDVYPGSQIRISVDERGRGQISDP